jgi:hypothetical protein
MRAASSGSSKLLSRASGTSQRMSGSRRLICWRAERSLNRSGTIFHRKSAAQGAAVLFEGMQKIIKRLFQVSAFGINGDTALRSIRSNASVA